MPKKNEKVNPEDLFDNLLEEAFSISLNSLDGTLSIIEFAEQIIFNGESKLYPTQKAILKAFYNEPLTEDELLILYSWKDFPDKSRTTWVDGRKYKNLVVEIGRRGTKSSCVSFITLYEFYKLITKHQPAVDYGFLPQTPLHIFVIAQSLDQVKETIFSAITGYAKGSNYFKKLESDGFIEILTEEIRCNSKNVHIHAKHTSSKSLVGYNLKLLVIDEAARFERDEYGNSKADEIWENVGAGAAAFGDEGMKIAISSAWEPGDYIEKMYELSEKEPKTLGFRLRTWDVNLNPQLTEEKLKSSDAYIKNPIKAALEYEGIRTIKQGTFFIQDNILKAFKGFSKCDTTQVPLNVSNEAGETRYYTGIKINRIETNFNLPSFAHCDYGIKRDGAALAVCSPIEVEGKWGISVDTLILWKPYLDTDDLNRGINRIVSFTNCEEIFLEIARHRKIYKFSFDGFQSQSTIQRLHLAGISTAEMSTANSMQNTYFSITKQLMDQGLLFLPKDSTWSASAQLELQNIIQLPNGKIDHPRDFSKDLADAICNAVYNCYIFMVQSGKITNSSGLVSSINKVASYKNPNPSSIYKVKNTGWALSKVRSNPVQR